MSRTSSIERGKGRGGLQRCCVSDVRTGTGVKPLVVADKGSLVKRRSRAPIAAFVAAFLAAGPIAAVPLRAVSEKTAKQEEIVE